MRRIRLGKGLGVLEHLFQAVLHLLNLKPWHTHIHTHTHTHTHTQVGEEINVG